MATTQTKVLSTEKTSTMTAKKLAEKIGRALGSPINGKNVGEKFNVTLTGEIQISEFGGRKSAHFLTKEGYKLAVNASFDPAKHKADAVFEAVCREVAVSRDGETVNIKFSAFAE